MRYANRFLVAHVNNVFFFAETIDSMEPVGGKGSKDEEEAVRFDSVVCAVHVHLGVCGGRNSILPPPRSVHADKSPLQRSCLCFVVVVGGL